MTRDDKVILYPQHNGAYNKISFGFSANEYPFIQRGLLTGGWCREYTRFLKQEQFYKIYILQVIYI